MEQLIGRLMSHSYWSFFQLQAGDDSKVARFARMAPDRGQAFVSLMMHGFFPLSAAVPIAWRRVAELGPSEEVRKTARFFVEVESGDHAMAAWYRGVPHAELYRRMFDSLAGSRIELNEALVGAYCNELDLGNGGLERSLVASAFIEKTGLQVLHLLHDFVLQWQSRNNIPTRSVDITYINEHMLLERSDSADQHVPLVNDLLSRLPDLDLRQEMGRFERLTAQYWTVVVKKIEALVASQPHIGIA